MTGAAAGLVFGIQDALTRQTLEVLQGNSITAIFTGWSGYALVGAGAVGIWLMQSAFSAGPLQASLPAISACEPLAGIFLGVVVFGDRVQVSAGVLALEASGLAALVVGVILVGRSPALSGLGQHRPTLGHHHLRHHPPPQESGSGEEDKPAPPGGGGGSNGDRPDRTAFWALFAKKAPRS